MYKLVPVDATDEMLEDSGTMNGYDYDQCGADADANHRDWYATMLDAAPNPWRPIAEADEYKDGTRLLLYPSQYIGHGCTVGWWASASRKWASISHDGWIKPTHFIPLEWLGQPEDGQ